jgi:hypothetical protein
VVIALSDGGRHDWADEFDAAGGQFFGEEPRGDITAAGRDQAALRTQGGRPSCDVGALATDTQVRGRRRVGVHRERSRHADDNVKVGIAENADLHADGCRGSGPGQGG